MTLQEAIQGLKQLRDVIFDDDHRRSIDTIISAYEITDEQIKDYADNCTNITEYKRMCGIIKGAKAFRDGKIKKP